MRRRLTFSVLAEVNATDLFELAEGQVGTDGNVNWRYCLEHANFAHHDEDACEFILHIGGEPGSESHAANVIEDMRSYGCTPEFIRAYAEARDTGALRVLFHV